MGGVMRGGMCLITLVGMLACSVPDFEPEYFSLEDELGGVRRPAEERILALAQAVQSFAGYYCDAGNLIIQMSNASTVEEATILALIDQDTLDSCRVRALPNVVPQAVIGHVQTNFLTLRMWRNSVSDEILETPGARSIAIDYRENAIVVNAEAIGHSVMAKHAVPSSSYRLLPPADLTPEVACANPSNGPTLVDCFRPVTAGVQINETSSGGGLGFGTCTVGSANDRWMPEFGYWQSGWITASHCTSVQFANQSNWIYQNNVDNQKRVGFEYVDPPGWTCGYYTCRNSDAAWIWADNAAAQHGTIARTLSTGSKTIDTGYPRFYIRGYPVAVQGMQVEKIGLATGWTTGYVTNTCADEIEGSFKLICQGRASYVSGASDSGAPVFRWRYWEGSNADLIGTHVGTTPGYKVYSPISNIIVDLGSLFLTYPY